MLPSKPTSRRKFLLSSLIALPALGITLKGLSAASAAQMAAPRLEDYTPTFFSAAEWAFVLAACDRLIPATGRGPGALETNVPVFIDQQLQGGLGNEMYLEPPFDLEAPAIMGYQISYLPQQVYQHGIRAVDAWCQAHHHESFARLDATLQDNVLGWLQAGDLNFTDLGEATLKSKLFFSELLAHTQQGYLSDPIYGGNKGMKAWLAIGFPGARASYLEWVTQHNVQYPLGPVSLSGQQA